MVQCCAYDCTEVGVHRFPVNKAVRNQWVAVIRRKNFKPTDASRLCARHFKKEDYYSEESSYTGLKSQIRKLKKDVVPSIFSWKVKQVTEGENKRANRVLRRDEFRRNLFPNVSEGNIPDVSALVAEEPVDNNCVEELMVVDMYECMEEVVESLEKSSKDEGDLNSAESEGDSHRDEKIKGPKTCTQSTALYSISMFKDDDEGMHFYTGLETYDKFNLVFQTVCPNVNRINYRYGPVKIKPEDALFLTLMKLRRNTADYELTKFFGLSKCNVSNVFVTWVNFLEQVWSKLDVWPSRQLVDFYMPEGFKSNYPSTRVILDGTEFPVSKPSQPAAQQATFSSYKNRNTVKVLVGCSPSGVLSFKSDAYGGSASDRQIVERSDLIRKCDKGDSVMADRGFTVQDLFASQEVTVNMPTFLKGRDQLKASSVLADRKLSSKRVHIERIIGLIKTYKILNYPLMPYFLPLASKIFSVCFMLCNFRECIISRTA